MERRYDNAVDFSKGMNTEMGASADPDAPLYLQDALIDRQPEIWQRGGYRYVQPYFKSSGEILASTSYGYGGTVGTITVTRRSDIGGTNIWFRYIDYDEPDPNNQNKSFLIHSIPRVASQADITTAWSTRRGANNEPDGIIVATDVGVFWIFWKPSMGNSANVFVIQESGTSSPLAGKGHLYCETVNGYTFLANRPSGGGQSAMRNRLSFSALYDARTWSDSERKQDLYDIGKTGGWTPIPTKDTVNIEALASMENNLLIFKRNQILSMTVTANPLDWSIRKISSTGTLDHRSIAYWQENIIFSNQTGIYMFNGSDMIPISAPIQSAYIEDLKSGGANSPAYGNNWRLVGEVFNDYYILSIRDGSGNSGKHVRTWMCYLPTMAWTDLSNLPLMDMCIADRGGTKIFGYLSMRPEVSSAGMLIRLDDIFDKPTGYRKAASQSIDGKDSTKAIRSTDVNDARFPKLKIKTRFRDMGDSFTKKTLRHVSIRYAMKNTNNNNNFNMAVKVQKGSEVQQLIPIGKISKSNESGEDANMINRRIPAIIRDVSFSVEILPDDAFNGNATADYIGISGIQLAFKPMRPGRTPYA